MLDGEELHKRFEEFVHSLEDGEMCTDALLVLSYIRPEHLDEGSTGYAHAFLGKPSMHRCIGLLELEKHELLTQDDD